MHVNGARVNEIEYSDGWIRTFGKSQIPKITKQEKFLLTNYFNEHKIEEIIIYLEYYRGITGDMAEFLLREIMRGNLDA